MQDSMMFLARPFTLHGALALKVYRVVDLLVPYHLTPFSLASQINHHPDSHPPATSVCHIHALT
jgi:hypothetical protein